MKTKMIIHLVFTFFFAISIKAQTKIIGKKYTAQVGASCKELTDGGCMIYSYCHLEFEKDSVLVLHTFKEYCTPKRDENRNQAAQKTKYRYTFKNNIIIIKNFNSYGKLTLAGKKLIGRIEMNYKEFVALVFKQE
jgi:hypothetical protein